MNRYSRKQAYQLLKLSIHELGQKAAQVRFELHSNKAYYIYNQHLNYTNICKNKCKFCAYFKQTDDPKAYVYSLEKIAQEIQKNTETSEVHIVGGLNPDLDLSYYQEMLALIKSIRPEIKIKAFTAVEIAFLAEKHHLSPEQVLIKLKKAGLDCLPGGGAEVFDPSLRQTLCPEKLPAQKWLQIHRLAHELGIPTNCTLLFGHIESWEQRLDHLQALRDLQDQTNGFLCFIPLPYQPQNNPLNANGPDGLDFLQMIAVARLFLDNIKHIKTYWTFAGIKPSQLALWFGADDFDGTLVEEKVGHAAGATTPKGLTIQELKNYITQAGFVPQERDTFFNPK